MSFSFVSFIYEVRSFSFICLIVRFAFALSNLMVGSDIITTHDGNVFSMGDFNSINSFKITSDVFVISSLVETCRITSSDFFSNGRGFLVVIF